MPASNSTRRVPDLQIGQKFGRLTIVATTTRRWANGYVRRYYVTVCECGGTREASIYNLAKGEVRSCGCLKRDDSSRRLKAMATKHGGYGSRLFWTWHGMKGRCRNRNDPAYKNYGGRGIRICDEWGDFVAFREWATAHGYRDDLTIERINVDGHYEPRNCEWIPRHEQARNRRYCIPISAFGETKLAVDWAKDPRCRVSAHALRRRIHRGWPPERAIAEPPRPS